MFLPRLSALALLPALFTPHAARQAAPAPTREPLVIEVIGERSAATPLRIIASNGQLVTHGVTRGMAGDTVHVTGPAVLTTHALVGVTTFISDDAGDFLHVVVRQGKTEVLWARGEMVVVIQTPQGPQIQAMSAPVELRLPR